jgi:hypothetical protein
MPVQSPNGLKATGAFLCLIVLSLTPLTRASASPFLTQDQNPFSLIHGQPQPTSAVLPDKGVFVWSLSLDITNTLNVNNNNQESLFMDFESYHLRFNFLYGLSENWALRIDAPFIYYSGGFLDSTVDNWHDIFGLPQSNRPKVINNQFRIFYSRNGTPVIDLTSPTSGLGDIQIGIGKKLHHDQQSALSLWSSIDIPTGDKSDLTGNDASDVSFWLATQYKLNPEWSTDANLGILFPGESNLGTLAVENNIWFGHAAIQWQPLPAFDLRVQFGGHTQFYSNSQLRPLGSAYNIVIGGTVHVSACSDFDIAVSEDIKIEATPDVSFLFSWKSKMGDCN